MHAEPEERAPLDRLFSAIDSQNSSEFVSFLTDDAEFRFGSAPPAHGRQSIASAVDAFFATIESLSHAVHRTWEGNGNLVCEGEVTYRRHDGRDVVIPFVDVFEFDGALISAYKIYIDVGPLFAD